MSTKQIITKIILRQPEHQPLDSINCLQFDPYRQSNHAFICGGWDGFIRYYEINSRMTDQIEFVSANFLSEPILSVCFGDKSNIAFAGLATGDIIVMDLSKNQSAKVGAHDAPICKVFWISKCQTLVSFGFDFKMKFWSLSNIGKPVKQFDLPDKTYTAAYDHPYILVGTGQNTCYLMNVNFLPDMHIPEINRLQQIYDVGSKFQCCRMNVLLGKIVFGCIDGRCIVGQIQDPSGGKSLCDIIIRSKVTSKTMKRQNSTSSNPLYGQANDIDLGLYRSNFYMVITGSEEISFFNTSKLEKPKRISGKCTVGRISHDGKYFVYAEGNDWSQGMNDLKKSVSPKIKATKFSISDLEEIALK